MGPVLSCSQPNNTFCDGDGTTHALSRKLSTKNHTYPRPSRNGEGLRAYIKVGADLYALRHIDVFESGQFLRYDRQHWVDSFGMLADARFGGSPSRSRRWRILTIEAGEFQAQWREAGRSPQWPLQVANAKMEKWGLLPVWLRARD